MRQGPEIAIIGAGLGGLTAALTLLKLGQKVRVFEQAPELTEVGAGLTLSSGAVKTFNWLGIYDDVKAKMSPPRGFPFLHYQTAELLAGTMPVKDGDPLPEPRRPGIQGGHIYRPDMQDILSAAVRRLDPDAIVLGHRLASLSQDADSVTATFANGQSYRADVLIGADGVRSIAREAILGDASAEFTGRMAYRFLLPAEQANPLLGIGGKASVWIGRSKTINRYMVANDRLLNCVCLVKTDKWTAEGWSTPSTPEELLEEFHDWHPDIVKLVSIAPRDKLIKWGIFERPPVASWRRGRISLLGDAAHPMQPWLGLGAAMAIEDGLVLGRCLTEIADPLAALDVYEAIRIPRSTEILNASRRQGELFDEVDPVNYPPPNAPAHSLTLAEFDPEMALTAG